MALQSSFLLFITFDIILGRRDWLIDVGGWVVRRGSWVVRRASCVVRRKSCAITHASLTRLSLVEFKDTIFLYTTLCIHEKFSPIKISKANLSAKYVLPRPLPFSLMFLAHSAFLMKCTCVQENHFRLKENSKIIAAFVLHSISLGKKLPVCFLDQIRH